MARIKINGLTAQEEMFCREVAYMMVGTDLSRIGIEPIFEIYLYMCYKRAYPKTRASVPSMQSMASRLFKKVKIRSRVEEIHTLLTNAIAEATVGTVSALLNQMLALTPADFHIIDMDTGVIRKRKEYELSVAAWWLVKRVTRYGYDRLTIDEIVDILAKFKGWYKPTEIINHNADSDSTDDVIFVFGGKPINSDEDRTNEGD